MTISHSWQIVSHARPTFCNVCREALVGVTSHGLSCGVCKLKAHKTCAAYVVKSCKWTTVESVGTPMQTCGNDLTNIYHQWLEGNLPVSAKCVVCDKTCGSVLRLQDWRCLWCRATVHSSCRSQYVSYCSLGPTRHSTVPPTCLSYNKETDEWKVMDPFPGSPLIVFVNSKSGNGHGDRFLIRLRQYLNPSQVYDLSSTGPKKGLQIFQHLTPLRLLVCGGDGSIGWVLKEIDALQLKAERVSVSVLPLGTGNDLARVCGWGAAIEVDVNIINLLEKYDVGTPRLLDRWSIMSVETNIADCLPEDDENEMNDRKGSIFGTTGNEVIRDICDQQLISEDELDFDDWDNDPATSSLDPVQLIKTMSVLREELNSIFKPSSELQEKESQECILAELVKITDTARSATHKNSNLYRLAFEIQELVFEYMPEKKIRRLFKDEDLPKSEIPRSKSKDLKEVENLSMKSFEQDIQTLKNKIDVKALNQKIEDFEEILCSSLNCFGPCDNMKSEASLKDSSDTLILSTKESPVSEKRTDKKKILRTSSGASFSNDSSSSDSEEEPQNEEDEKCHLPAAHGEEDLLVSNLSPLPSPTERSFSLTGHAKDLPVPEAFSDKAIEMWMNKAGEDYINKTDSFVCPEILITPSSKENTSEEKGDPSKDDIDEQRKSPISSEAPKSRRRFTSSAGLLSSVPEDGQLSPSYTPSIPSPDPALEYSSLFSTNQGMTGSRRLSVGAMVSLSSLRSGEAGCGKPASTDSRSGSCSQIFSSSNLASAFSAQRPYNKVIPIINPMVKTPNWPYMDKNPNAGIISMVVLASADALCAPVTPIMDWTPPAEKMKETSVMNNYFGIGIDAKISLDFHNKREQKPQGARSRTKNYLWYGMLGSKELLQKTCKNLEKRVVLECDGEPIPLPSLQGIVVLNIKSFMGGTNFWGSAKDDDIFLPPNFDDGILEVVAVFGSMHMGASRIMNLQRHRIAQCRSVVIRILGKEGVPVQVDGEAWIHPPGIIRILHKNRVQLVTRDKSMEQRLRSGANTMTLYREHVHPVLLPFDEEESQLLRSVIASAKHLLHYMSLLQLVAEGKESRNLEKITSNLQESISSVSLDDFMSVEAYDLRRKCASFVNNLQICISASKKSLVDILQEESSSEIASNLSQSIYTVESLLGKCHEEADLLFFTIRDHDSHERRKSWFRVPKFVKSSEHSGRGSSPSAGPPSCGGHATSESACSPPSSGGCLVEVVLKWTPSNVSQWLESLGLSLYCHAFMEHEISGFELLSLERRDFKDLGVSKVGHIKRLQQGIKDIKEGKMSSRLLQNTTTLSSSHT